MSKEKIIIFGGNGFVGTHIAEQLVHLDCLPICVSRSGVMPLQLSGISWAKEVEWLKGDALKPDMNLMNDATAVITLIGSAPVPTFSNSAYQKQFFMNSEPNISVIKAVSASSVQRLVVLGAHVPKVIRGSMFAYVKGKIVTADATKAFVEISPNHSAVLLEPTAIYGTRFTKSGKPLNIAAVMSPIAKLQSLVPNIIKKILPETLVSVNAVANSAARVCLDESYAGNYTCLSNQKIIEMNEQV